MCIYFQSTCFKQRLATCNWSGVDSMISFACNKFLDLLTVIFVTLNSMVSYGCGKRFSWHSFRVIPFPYNRSAPLSLGGF